MPAVVLHSTTVEETLKHWEFVLCHFRPDAIYILGPVVESQLLERERAVYINDAGDLPAELPLVLMAPRTGAQVQGDEPLSSFVHPGDGVYWFGSDHRHLDPILFARRAPDHRVCIETDTGDQMHAHVAYAVTMWDRRLKEGKCGDHRQPDRA